jgi:hypothetical protein
MPEVREDERDRRGHEQRAAPRRRRKREQPERAARARRKRGQSERAREGRDAEPARTENDRPRLVDDQERERGEHRSLVHDDVGRVDAGHLRDEREERVPERKRVARVQPTVHELVDRVHREVVECPELADARQVEERVAGRVGQHAPEQQPHEDAHAEHTEPVPVGARASAPERERQRRHSCRDHQPERERDRRPRREHDDHRREEEPEARDERARGRAREQRAGSEQEQRRSREAQVQLDHGRSKPRAACR